MRPKGIWTSRLQLTDAAFLEAPFPLPPLPEQRAIARYLDWADARIEHDKALLRVMTALINDDTELFKQFMDNSSFKRWLTDTVFVLTYEF